MKLESHRVKEVKKDFEKAKNNFDSKELKRSIESLNETLRKLAEEEGLELKLTDESKEEIKNTLDDIKPYIRDIDQQEIIDNESKEFKLYTSKNDNNQNVVNQREQSVFDKTDKLTEFIKPSYEQKKSELDTEFEEQFNLINKKSDNEELPRINYVDLHTLEEKDVIDNSALIDELNNKIDKKYNLLMKELEKLYNSEIIEIEANNIKSEIQRLMEQKKESIDELRYIDKSLRNLMTRFNKLSQKADEVKTKDDFTINQYAGLRRNLEDFQISLQKKYGKYWFAKIDKQEKEKYIDLYSKAYKVSKDSVDRMIEDSVSKAYEEVIKKTEEKEKQNSKQNTSEQVTENKEESLESKYGEMIKFNIRTGVEMLKNVYSNIDSLTPEQVEEFKYLYDSLSKCSKTIPTNNEEEREKFNQTSDLWSKIDKLNYSINNESKMKM